MKILRFAFLLVLVAIPASMFSQGAWIKQRSGTLAWLHAVYFVDRNTGWVGGAGGTLLSTEDGGNSWRQLRKPTEDSIHDIHFIDGLHGWLLCDRDTFKLRTFEESSNYLLRTDDGAKTWRRIEIGGNDLQARLVRFVFSQKGKAWIFGEAGTLLKSDDYGETWKRQPLVTRFLLLGGDFVSANQGCVVGAGVTIIHTADGGESWHTGVATDRPAHVRFSSVSFSDERQGWIVGDAGRIYATVDGGNTWRPQASNVEVDLSDVKFNDSREGWITGSGGTLVHTVDGGMHWNAESTGTTHPLDRLFVAGPGRVWAVGFGGTILSNSANREKPKLRAATGDR